MGINGGEGQAVLYHIHNGQHQIVHSAYAADDGVALKANAAQLVVHRPLPGRVRVTVKENAALHFAGALLHSRYIMAGLFREAAVNQLFVQTKLHKYNEQTHNNQHRRQQWAEEKANNGRQHKGDGKVNPTKERAGVLLKGLHICPLAAAVFLQHLGHVFTGLLLTLRARLALFKIPANVGDLIHHVVRIVVFLIDNVFQIHKNTPFL